MARNVALLLALAMALVLAAVLTFAPVTPLVARKDNLPKPSLGNSIVQNAEGFPKVTSLTGNGARDVGGGMVATPVGPGEALERVEAQTPPQSSKPVDVPMALPDTQKRWRIVFNSVITAAGMFDLNGMSIILPGIDIISPDEKCPTSNGQEWPCGAAARTAFRAYVRNRAINCHLPLNRTEKALVAECLLQGEDPAEWLVNQGWARAMPNSPLAELEKAARNARRGVFAAPPPGSARSADEAGNEGLLNSAIRPKPFQ